MSPNVIEQQAAASEPARLEREEPAGQPEPGHQNGTASNGMTRNGTPEAHANGQETSAEAWRVVLLPVDKIAPCPYQPRLLFDPAEMAELTESVKAHGVQQPVLVRPAKGEVKGKDASNGKTALPYELVAGERRLRACKEARRRRIPAIVRELDDRTAAEIALTENVQRSNLSAIEEARGYKQLMLKFRMSEERIAKKVGKSVATIQATMKLLALPGEVQDLLAKRQLTASHGHALLPLASHAKVCLSVAYHALANNVTASSLSQTLLPNVRELVQKKLVQELDFRTKFDFRAECAKCPFKAYVQSGYSSYCLKPAEWHKKQVAAVEQQKSEAAQAMQRVRDEVSAQEEAGQVDVTHLPAGSYRDLSHVELPAGCCEACPCRREVADPRGENKKVPVCLDPARFQSLREAERKAHEEQRRRHYLGQWTQAVSTLQDEVECAESRKAAVLLTSLVLRNELYRGGQDEGAMLPRSVALNLGIALPWSDLIEAHDDGAILKLLEGALNTDDGTDGERETLTTGQALYAPDPNRMLLFASAMMLASEAQHAIKWTESTPRLDFVLGPQGVQGQLDVTEPQAVSGHDEELPDAETETSPFPEGEEEDETADDWQEDAFEEEGFENEPLDGQPVEHLEENRDINPPEE